MPIVSNLNITSGGRQATFELINNGSKVTTYTFKDDKFTFTSRPQIEANKDEMLSFIDQINYFNQSMLSNFPEPIWSANGWSKINYYCEVKKDSIEFSFDKDNIKVMDASANIKTRTVTLKARSKEVVLTYPEWKFYIYVLNMFRELISQNL